MTASAWAPTPGSVLQYPALVAPGGAGLVGFIQSGVGAVARTLQDKSREVVSVTDYGADPTGVVSCVLAVQRAQDSLPASGGIVVWPPGIYRMSGSYPAANARVLDGVKLRSNVTHVGVYGATEIRLDDSCVAAFDTRTLAAAATLADVVSNLAFFNLKFTHPGAVWNSATENTGLLAIGGVNGLKIQGCQFIGWPGDAVFLGANNNAGLSAVLQTYVNDVEISGCLFDGVTKTNRQAISLLCGTKVHIHHNHITRTTRSTVPQMPGAIDIEPILASALVSEIYIHNNTFDDIGGTVGVVGLACGTALTVAAHNIEITHNTFKNITNLADVSILGRGAASHAAIAAFSPNGIKVNNNTHEAVPVGASNGRWIFGGIKNLEVQNNTIIGGNRAALLGYDDGANHYPIEGFFMKNNLVRDFVVEGTIWTGAFFTLGGLITGEITDNTFVDTGNMVAGVPAYCTVLQWGAGGLQSKNIVLSNNKVINSGAFNVVAAPFYAPAAGLVNPTTFKAKGNAFIGFNQYPYNGAESIYSQVDCDYYQGFITFPSTGTPAVGGASRFIGNTGDTYVNFSGGHEGQEIIIVGATFGFTVQNNATVFTSTGANVVVAANKTIKLLNSSGKWYQT